MRTSRLSARARRLLLGATVLCAVLSAFGGTASAKGKITLCHRVGGPNYVVITVAPEAALAGHAANHPLDIIPAFTYRKGGATVAFPGQNVDEGGIAILGNQCVVPLPPADPGDAGGGSGGDDNGNGNAYGRDIAGGDIALCHEHGPGAYHEEELAPFDAFLEHAVHPGDIIPAFSYTGPAGDAVFDGQNLTEENIALLAHGCSESAADDIPVAGQPLVELAKTGVDVNGGLLVPGDLVTFTIVATNIGSVPATNVVISDPISAGTAYVVDSAVAAPGIVVVADDHLTAHVGAGATAEQGGTLAAGGSATVSFSVRVAEDLPAGATILDVAHATAADRTGDPLPETDSDLVEFPVDTPPAVPAGFTTDAPTDTPTAGSDLVTTLTLTPTADLQDVAVCLQVQIPPRAGSTGLGTTRSTCKQLGAVKRGKATRSVFDVRIPRRTAGQCIRLKTAIRADGFTPKERSTRLCVRARAATHVEAVTG